MTLSNWQHIYPTDDWIEHKLVGLDCICEPKIDWENSLVIHNSADGREIKEVMSVKKDILEALKSEIAWCVKNHKKSRDIDQGLYIQEKGFINGLRQAVRIIKKV